MRFLLLSRKSLVLTFLGIILAGSCFAQVPLEPSQLPARTGFYFIWRGTPTGDVRHANAMLGLWDDPGFAPVRSAFAEAILSDSQKSKDKPPLTREELLEFSSLLDNALVMGYLNKPADLAAAKKAAPGVPAWNGMFLVYDRTGKEALLSKAILRSRAGGTEIPKLTTITVAGVSALKIERKASVNYWAETGKFAVAAGEMGVFEEILTRLGGKGGSSTLDQSAAYQEAKSLLGTGVMEFFFRVPDLKTLAMDSADTTSPSSAQGKAVLDALKLDSIHSIAGHVSLEGPKTRLQGAILGDTSAGTLFDIWAGDEANPASLALVSQDTISYNEWQMNFLGLYNILKRALAQSGPNSAQIATALESMAATRLGMPLTDALALTTGEIASIQNSPVLDTTQQIHVLGIRDKADTLKLLRSIMGDKVSAERAEGSTTFVKVSLGGAQGSAGVTQFNFYHLALTPNLLLGSSKVEPIRTVLAQSAGAGAPKNLLAVRGQFPEKLNGFSYFDFQKVDWPGMKATWIAETKKATADAKTSDAASTKKTLDWLNVVDPSVFPHQLHTLVGASWKDAKGVHFDEWMD